LLLVALAVLLSGQIVGALRSDVLTGVLTAMPSMAAVTALGLFGLDPAAARLSRPAPARPDPPTVSRRLARVGALTIVPVVLAVQQMVNHHVDGLVPAAGQAVVAALIAIRSDRSAAEHARTERALRHRATHDPLTGLPNRTELVARVAALLGRIARCVNSGRHCVNG